MVHPYFSQRWLWRIILGGGLGTSIIITTYQSVITTTPSSPGTLNLGGTVSLNGAGTSFPSPLYETWFQALNQKYPNLRINYQSVGSGAGVKQFIKGTVDFGASDFAMKDEEIAKVNLLQLPTNRQPKP